MEVNTPQTTGLVTLTLQQEYQAGEVKADAIRSILCKRGRTPYNYIQGITEPTPEQLLELAVSLDNPRLFNSLLIQNGFPFNRFRLRRIVSVEVEQSSGGRAECALEGVSAILDMKDKIDRYLEDGRIDPPEHADLQRDIDNLIQTVMALPLGALDTSFVEV